MTELKQSEPWLYNYHSKMLQTVSAQIDGSQKAITELNKKGYKTGQLRFCRYFDYGTFTYNQTGYKFEQYGKHIYLHLSKIGHIEIRLHREIPTDSKIKQVIVTKSKSRRWFACITLDIQEPLIPKRTFCKCVGIDVVIKSFTCDSDGNHTPNPKNLQKMLKPLARIQRKVSRRKKGSNNRMKNHRLAQSIVDASWGSFVQKLEYKCRMLMKVPARNTTTDCSRCSSAVPKSLAIRIHKCDKCGLMMIETTMQALTSCKKD